MVFRLYNTGAEVDWVIHTSILKITQISAIHSFGHRYLRLITQANWNRSVVHVQESTRFGNSGSLWSWHKTTILNHTKIKAPLGHEILNEKRKVHIACWISTHISLVVRPHTAVFFCKKNSPILLYIHVFQLVKMQIQKMKKIWSFF